MRNGHRSALVFALLAFALLSVGDAVVKSMAGMWPGTAISALRYLLGAVGLGAVLFAREGRAGFAYPKFRWQMLRGLSVSISAVSFFSAVQLMPIGEATAISFTSPMITALLAALILKEPLRRETWIASAVAFAGVLIILRPNFGLLGWVALLPVLAATGMAFLMIANRKVAGTGSALAMQFNVASIGAFCLFFATVTGHFSGLAFFAVAIPSATVIAKCALIAVTATAAHACLFIATTRADASAIAPMTYVQLLLAGGFGWVLFGERPDALALLGSAVIVVAGLYLWRSGKAPPETVLTD
ncbi:MAG: EamA family transporter [Novosphingobium sp. 32-60-15]|uniref:DMT family transporter n=1 Tax=unclassified Novosphingobium TaxID=2644732 RepID=UPI000BD41769|nr:MULTISPECIES: DMT family transporter [unclassified Novosphingobium]OYX63718.1 MAG: EamA family transporter [Novosphingobium sp. 32-60-15]